MELKLRVFTNGKMYGHIHALTLLYKRDILLEDNGEFIIMMFTGLVDKNGKEIFEGDIIDVCNGSINGIEWKDKPYEVRFVLNKGFDMCMFCWDKKGNNMMNSTHYCEVIGDIHTNPNLIK